MSLTEWGTANKHESIIRRSFKPDDLLVIESDFRMILMCCNKCGRIQIQNDSILVAGERNATSHSITPPCGTVRDTPGSGTATCKPTDDSTPRKISYELPDELRLANLRCTKDGMVDMRRVHRLAAFEFMFHHHCKGKIGMAIREDMVRNKLAIPSDFPPERFVDEKLSVTSINSGAKHIKQARNEWVIAMHGVYTPKPEEHLWEWLQEGRSYTEGKRVEANNFTLSNSNRKPELSLEAAFILWHIMFSFSLDVSKVFGLWASFYALLMRREIPMDYFRSQKAIWMNVIALQPIDDHMSTNRFREYITAPTPLGFRRYFYSSSDDSEHFKANRHVLIVSHVKQDSDEPTFRHVTSSVSITKDSDGNSLKNAQDMMELFGPVICAYYGGGCNDNAADAQLEIRKTFNRIMTMVAAAGYGHLIYVNDVLILPITFGDPFHINNLAVTHCSLAAFGDVDKGDHEQAHHRQLLHSINNKIRKQWK